MATATSDPAKVTTLEEFQKLVVEVTKKYDGGCPSGKADFLSKLGLGLGDTITVTANVQFQMSVEDFEKLKGTAQVFTAVAG